MLPLWTAPSSVSFSNRDAAKRRESTNVKLSEGSRWRDPSLSPSASLLLRGSGLRGFATIGCVLGGALLGVLLNHRHGRVHRLAHKVLRIFLDPIVRGLTRDVRVLEYRRDVLGPQLVGFDGLVERRPVVRELQERAELALLGLEALHLRDG